MGLRVSRPARLAVSSPNANAPAPWATSCRITEGTSTMRKRTVFRLRCMVGRALSKLRLRARNGSTRFGRAVDAVAGPGHGLEPRFGNGLVAALALAVAAVFELGQGVLHLLERFLEARGTGLGLASLGRHLTGIGEVGVVLEAGLTLPETEVEQLLREGVALVLQGGPEV